MKNDATYLARIKAAMDACTSSGACGNKVCNIMSDKCHILCGICHTHNTCFLKYNCDEDEDEYADDDDDDDIYRWYEYVYCSTCQIMYYYDPDCASSYSENDYEESYGHYITQWQDIETDTVYDGMPVFENVMDAVAHFHKIRVLKLWCYDGSCQCPVPNESSYI